MLQIAATFSASELTANPEASLGVTLAVLDTDPFITQLTATVDWGDGLSTDIGTVTAPYGPVTLVHGYAPGNYSVRINARNFRTPTPQTALTQQAIVVLSSTAAVSDAPATLFGPILPRLQGSPSVDNWNFNLGKDGYVLSSSLLMLFLTACGERVYDSSYGSNLRQLIFSPDDSELSTLARQEIARAAAAHEPRVEFIGADAARTPGTRSIRISAEFRSLLSRQPLVLNLAYAP